VLLANVNLGLVSPLDRGLHARAWQRKRSRGGFGLIAGPSPEQFDAAFLFEASRTISRSSGVT